MRMMNVQFYSTTTYTYGIPDDFSFPDEVQPGDLVLVPVGDHKKTKNYTEMWKVARCTRELTPDEVMEAKSKARKLGYEIKDATLYLAEDISL